MNDDLISIEGVLKPALVREYENDTSTNASLLSDKCVDVYGCPSIGKSFSALPSVLGMIGNVSSNISILILEGQNDSQTPLQQALLLQQRLTAVIILTIKLLSIQILGIHLSLPING